MIARGMFLIMLFSLSLVALASCSPSMIPANTRTPVIPPLAETVVSPTVINEPIISIPTISPAPPEEPTSSEPSGVPIPLPTNPYQPRPGDERFTRGPVFIETVDLLIRESYPPQYAVMIKGNLPTPCHEVRAVVEPPEMSNKIKINVFSLVDPEKICVQVLAKFEMTISLGSFPAGNYEVWVNDMMIGHINAP